MVTENKHLHIANFKQNFTKHNVFTE